MIIQFSVTESEIERGRPHSSCGCPIALAIRKRLSMVAIVGTRIQVVVPRGGGPDDNVDLGKTPVRCGRFIGAFDSGDQDQVEFLEPFEFELEVPDELLTDSPR